MCGTALLPSPGRATSAKISCAGCLVSKLLHKEREVLNKLNALTTLSTAR